MFVRITFAPTELSVAPDVTMSFDPASRIVLVLAHVAVAAIIEPTLARALPAER